jgi:hypothetical protein
VEAIADLLNYVNDNHIPGDLTIQSDAQAVIERVGHTGAGPEQETAIRIVKAVQYRHGQWWRTWV